MAWPKGRPKSDEQRKKLSEAQKGRRKTEAGWELEHRVVMARELERPLRDDEIVHHRDEDKKNNSPENLELTTHEEHSREHQNFRK